MVKLLIERRLSRSRRLQKKRFMTPTPERDAGPQTLSDYEEERQRALRTVCPAERQRREPRFPFCFRVRVSGTSQMITFHEQTTTVDISRAGCRFSLRTHVVPGSYVSIAAQQADGSFCREHSALYAVVWTRREGERYLVGAELLDGPELWNMSFPEPCTGGW